MAESKIVKNHIYTEYGRHSVRVTGVCVSASEVLVFVPWTWYGETLPTITPTSGAMTGVGTVTATLDSTRTNKDEICFKLTKSGTTFTNHYAYACQVDFTIS